MQVVVNYLQSHHDSFWQFEESGNVVAIPRGNTIGYSEMILSEVVYYLAPQGLPRFGSLLLALAAINPRGEDSLLSIDVILHRLDFVNEDLYIVQGNRFLKLLSLLPDKFKKGRLRLEVLRAIFQNSHNSIGINKSLQIQQAIKGDLDIAAFSSILDKVKGDRKYVENDFKVLALIGDRYESVNDIIASLSDLPPIEYEVVDPESDKDSSEGDIIDQLINEPKTFHLGALVSKMISGLSIPFHSSLPSPQPLGGVADITNKGNFDKLLISEYAFDDTVLMSRLANNESLYHHREVPPADNQYHRLILVDITIKSWGTIRTIAFATMLAIVNHPKNKNPIRVVLVGRSYREIGFDSQADIVEGMQYLDSSLDPALGLTKLFTEEKIDISEIFYIGNKEALDHPDMHLFTAEFGKRIDHWIHPTMDGTISVYKNPRRGKRFIQEFKINLEEAWKIKGNSTIKESSNVNLVYPILFPVYKNKSVHIDRGYRYILSKEKALFQSFDFNNFNHGQAWKMIRENWSPKDLLMAVYTNDDSSVTALLRHVTEKGYKDKLQLWNIELDERIDVTIAEKKLLSLHAFGTHKDFFYTGDNYAQYRIYLDGNVTKHEKQFHVKEEHYSIRHNQVYKNITRIGITAKNKLRFGVQDLFIKRGHLFLQSKSGIREEVKCYAESGEEGIFTFNEGSTIRVNKNGMLILDSSNQDIPQIFIPAVINKTIAAATEGTFAGNVFYRLDVTKKLIARQIVEDESKIREALSYEGFRGDKIMEKLLRYGFVESDNFSILEMLHSKCKKISFKTELLTISNKQESISIEEFYQKYVRAFIEQILLNGY